MREDRRLYMGWKRLTVEFPPSPNRGVIHEWGVFETECRPIPSEAIQPDEEQTQFPSQGCLKSKAEILTAE